MSDPHRRAFSEGGGIDGARAIRTAEVQSRPIPVPRKHRSDKREASSFEDSFTAINLSDDQPVFASSDVQSLLSRVEQLKNEEMCLIEHITSLRKEKMEIEQNSQFKELKKREIELAEHEQDLNLRKSRIDSEYSDREFKLAQKQRELQHLEDQLHMKSKDLKQKEFDIANADSPADVSSTQLAELANRQFELERREQELQYKQDYLHEWSLKLQEKENEYKRRWDDLLCRESSFYSQAQASPLHYNYSSDYDRQRQSPRTSDQVRAENPHAPAYGQSFGGQQVIGSRNDEYKDHRIDQLPDDSSQHQSTTERLQPLNVFPERKQDNQIAKDLELAQKLMEEEESCHRTAIYTDEMLALTLQQEEMDSKLLPGNEAPGGAVSIIKKELDERLTEEQRRLKQEEEDFIIAKQLLDSELPADNSNSKVN